MKRILIAALALSLMSGTAVVAQPNNQDRNDQGHNDQGGNRDPRNDPSVRMGTPHYSRGDRVPTQYQQNQYVVSDWQQRKLRKPPRGYHWVRNDNNDYFLAAITTGIIADLILNSR